MKVRVMYAQKFMGEVITANFVTNVHDINGIEEIKSSLYSDSHVIDVEVELLEEEPITGVD